LQERRYLIFLQCEFDEDALKSLGDLTTVREFRLTNLRQWHQVLANLPRSALLRRLDLVCGQTNDADLDIVSHFACLRRLDVRGGTFTDAGIQKLGRLRQLVTLAICSLGPPSPSPTEDAAHPKPVTVHLPELPHLRMLALVGLALTDQDLPRLTAPGIDYISLDTSAFSSSGLKRLIASRPGMTVASRTVETRNWPLDPDGEATEVDGVFQE
jgi:hypothetical protein